MLKGDSVKEVLNFEVPLNRNGRYYFIGYACFGSIMCWLGELIYEMGNVKLNTINEMCLIFEWY